MSGDPLPVTVIGGYLGAGKTTLVNHLLRHADGRRLAVLVNEFGDLPIDADLIEAADDQMISIAGGCICCSFGNDLTAALIDLSARVPRPDHILIEASGVAIPRGIMGTLTFLDGLAADGVVVLADAATILAAMDDAYVGDTIRRQLSEADIVLLNKVDLVDADARADLTGRLADLFPKAAVVLAEQARVPLAAIVGTGGGIGPPGHVHHADALFDSVVLTPPPGTDAAALAREIATGPYGVVRAKGYVAGSDGMALIHVVGTRWQTTPARDDARAGIVCIGPRDRLQIHALVALGG